MGFKSCLVNWVRFSELFLSDVYYITKKRCLNFQIMYEEFEEKKNKMNSKTNVVCVYTV